MERPGYDDMGRTRGGLGKEQFLDGVITDSHVDEYVAASGKPLRRAAARLLARYRQEAGPLYYRVSCGECLSACPQGVAVNEILRYAMYYENYGMGKNAVSLYRSLPRRRKPTVCGSCVGPCERSCPYGFRVKERLLYSHRLLRI